MRRDRLLLLGLAVLSGAAALVYQTVWLRWFRLLFGSTTQAASATLFAFFAGVALGSALFGRRSERLRGPALRTYGRVEIGIAIAALLVPLVLRAYDPIYAALYERISGAGTAFVAVKFALGFAAMLPAALLIGGTLPLLTAAFVREPRDLGRAGGLLYATNTLGALVGTAVAALWLPELWGIRATYGLALGLSVVVGAVALWAAREAGPPPRATPDDPAPAPAALLGIAFASGLGTLAVEVLLVHALAQLNLQSVYSFGAVLIVVLASLSLGAALSALLAGRLPVAGVLGGVLVLEAVLLLLLPWSMVAMRSAAGWEIDATGLAEGLVRAALLGGPVLLVGGLVLPLTLHLAAGGVPGRRVGGLVAANTVGGILGSALAGFVLVEAVGLWGGFSVIALGYAGAALAVAGSLRARLARAAVLTAALALVALGPLRPWELPVVALAENQRLLALDQGAYGVTAVVEQADGSRRLLQNGIYAVGSSRSGAHAERAGHLPLLLHPDPRRVLFLGSASGGTAAAAVAHPVAEIVLVELVPAIQELARAHFDASSRFVHSDPRTRLVTEDGRNHLRAVPDRYDVIVADLFVPWRSGVGSLYTREHFEAVRDRLTHDGVFCQWLPIFQLGEREFAVVAATFLSVFPNATVWRGDFYARRPRAALIGFAGSPPPTGLVARRGRSLARAGVADPWLVDPFGPWMLYVGPLEGAARALAGASLNRDDHPRFEFLAAASTRADREYFTAVGWPTFAGRLSASPRLGSVFPDHPGPGPAGGAELAALVALRATEGEAAVEAAPPGLGSDAIPERFFPLDWTVSDHAAREEVR